MERVKNMPRAIEARLGRALDRQKSVLLLGPRQTGKTTLVEALKPDLLLNFLEPAVRQRYERTPQQLGAEVEALAERTRGRKALVALDEMQRVPELVNAVQDLIDRRMARFILTGSSARKLRRGTGVNLLPGRLLPLRLDPLSLMERVPPRLEEALLYGSLPGLPWRPTRAGACPRACSARCSSSSSDWNCFAPPGKPPTIGSCASGAIPTARRWIGSWWATTVGCRWR